MTERRDDNNDPVLKAIDKAGDALDKKLDAVYRYFMTPERGPKPFISRNIRIVFVTLAIFILGLYFLTPQNSAEDRNFFVFFIVAGILPMALLGWGMVWIVSKILNVPVVRKKLEDELRHLDPKPGNDFDAQKAEENARNNGPIDDKK